MSRQKEETKHSLTTGNLSTSNNYINIVWLPRTKSVNVITDVTSISERHDTMYKLIMT